MSCLPNIWYSHLKQSSNHFFEIRPDRSINTTLLFPPSSPRCSRSTWRANPIQSNSTPIPLHPQAPESLSQFPRAARASPDALLPLRVFLPVARGPRLSFYAHWSPVGGGRGHFDAVGCVAGVGFVLLEGFFEGVGGFAFSFEVFGVVLLVVGMR